MGQVGGVDRFDTQPAERALVDLYPVATVFYGALPTQLCGIAIKLAFAFTTTSHVDTLSSSGGVIGLVIGYSLLAYALARIPPAAAAVLAIVKWFGVLLTILGAVLLSTLFHSIFILLALASAGFMFATFARCWWSLRKIDRQVRLLVSQPFEGLLSARALRAYLGLPQVLAFLRKRRFAAHLYTIAAGMCSFGVFYITGYLIAFYIRPAYVPGAEPSNDLLFGIRAGWDVDLLALVVVLAAMLALAKGGHFLTRKAQSSTRLSLDELSRTDLRKPVLFLRSFRDDQVILPEPTHRWLGALLSFLRDPQPLDQVLLEEGTPFGPVVALGNPQDAFPPYGAARGYFEHKTWQQSVADLCNNARAIVLCLDETDSIWWETQHIAGKGYMDKTLFVLPPKCADSATAAAVASELIKHLSVDGQAPQPALQENLLPGRTIGLFIGQDGRWKVVGSATFSRFAYLALVRLFFRSKFGLAIEKPSSG